MFYKTPSGHKYHIKFGCHGATIPATVSVSNGVKEKSETNPTSLFCLDCMGQDVANAGHALVNSAATGSFINLSEDGKFFLSTKDGVDIEASQSDDTEVPLPTNPFSDIESEAFKDVTIDDFKRVLSACEELHISHQYLPIGLRDEVVKNLSKKELETLLMTATLTTAAGATELRKELGGDKNQEEYAYEEGYAKLSPEARHVFDRLGGTRSTSNNETAGVAAEIALADAYGVPVSPDYRSRGNQHIQDTLTPAMLQAMEEAHCRPPVRHTAERGNPVDFQLEGGKTLSLKTNSGTEKKVCPQISGQMTFAAASDFLHEVLGCRKEDMPDPDTEKDAFKAFYKQQVLDKDNMIKILTVHFEHLFECDGIMYCSDAKSEEPSVRIYGKYSSVKFVPEKLTVVRDLTVDDWEQWNDSLTIHYCGMPLGEFQVEGRNDFKFRFHFPNLICLLEAKEDDPKRLEATLSEDYRISS